MHFASSQPYRDTPPAAIEIAYEDVERCPLCQGRGEDRAILRRTAYSFGRLDLPLPATGVFLRECSDCSLLYKSAVPARRDLVDVMTRAATAVWKPKRGPHPALTMIEPYARERRPRILDIGAANGDLLAQLAPYAACLSALDVVSYPGCRELVNGEYIVGEIEGHPAWSGRGYDLVTAFDIFEHFLDTQAALGNISDMVATDGGRLIVETGDWSSWQGDLGAWYYANLFEHQIFWNRRAFEYFCQRYGFKLIEYRRVSHKNRRAMGRFKRAALATVVKLAPQAWFRYLMRAARQGDPRRFAPASLRDHAFVVCGK